MCVEGMGWRKAARSLAVQAQPFIPPPVPYYAKGRAATRAVHCYIENHIFTDSDSVSEHHTGPKEATTVATTFTPAF
jgi:hypothetical protein